MLVLLIPAAWLMVALVAGRVLEAEAVAEAPSARICGRSVVTISGDGRTRVARSTRVVLVLDEAWRLEYGDGAEPAARLLLARVSGLFKGVHIHLLPVGTVHWSPPAEANTAESIVAAAREEVDRGSGDIVIVFTGRVLAETDGWADSGGRYAAVSHHPNNPERDAYVLAHEVAHLFGATHGCDIPGQSGLMAVQGFAEARLICPCTRLALEANALQFHDWASEPPQGPSPTPSPPGIGR